MKWVENKRQELTATQRAISPSPADVVVSPNIASLDYPASQGYNDIFATTGKNPPDILNISLTNPPTQSFIDFGRRDLVRAKEFWVESHNKDHVLCVAASNSKMAENKYRQRHELKTTLPSYFGLLYGVNGNTAMLGHFATMVPQSVSNLVPYHHDLITRWPADAIGAGASQQQTGALSALVPNREAYEISIKACANCALGWPDGTSRLREIERGASMVTHYLSHKGAFGWHIDPNRGGGIDDLKEALKAATALNRVDGEHHSVYLSRASKHFSSAMGDGFFKDLKVLFENIIPTDVNCNREYQAICIAIVAIGISNFGTSMAKKFEHRKDVIGKSLEVAGAVLGRVKRSVQN